jgi:spermidine synthase
MQPWTTLARARTPDGSELTLAQRGDEYAIRAGGKPLMSSREHGSEEVMSIIAARRAGGPGATWLVGGLGLGYTLRTALDRLSRDSKVVVAELLPDVVEWNRGPLAHLADRPLDDARVEVYVGDVRRAMAEKQGTFDAILLDVDNGPSALTDEGNHPLYGPRGLRTIRGSLRRRGTLVVWSAAHDARFVRRLENEGFRVEVEEVGSRGGVGGRRHVLFVAQS